MNKKLVVTTLLSLLITSISFATNTEYGVIKSSSASISNVSVSGNLTVTGVFRESMKDYTKGFFVGTVQESISLIINSNGSVISASLEASGGGSLTVLLNGSLETFDTIPAVTIALTAGSDTSPQLNYIFLEDDGGITLKQNTTGFPIDVPIIHLATVICQSSASLQTDGAMKVHLWTDHIKTLGANGHLSHINSKFRAQHADWSSGVTPNISITTNGGSPDNVDLDITSGSIFQLHKHLFPSFDTSVSSEIYIVNNFTTPFTKITDLNQLLTDSTGASMSGKRFTLVVWGQVSEATTDSKLFINLPNGSYGSDNPAIGDDNRTANYNIPSSYRGVGFLIARITLRHRTTSGGTWSLLSTIEDLRGQYPSTFVGGTASTAVEFPDNTFKVFDNTDSARIGSFQLDQITTGNTRVVTWPDRDLDLDDPIFDSITSSSASISDVSVSNNMDVANRISGCVRRVHYWTPESIKNISASGGNLFGSPTYPFYTFNSTGNSRVAWSHELHKNYSRKGTPKVELFASMASSGLAGEKVRLQMIVNELQTNSAIISGATTQQIFADFVVPATADYLFSLSFDLIDYNVPSDGESLVWYELGRDGSHSNDNRGGSLRLFGIEIYWYGNIDISTQMD